MSGPAPIPSVMTAEEVAAHPADRPHRGQPPATTRMRERMQATGQWHPAQVAGRRWGIGCVALEITQRCNLDCTICYLSENAEAIHDLPVAELERRIDQIVALYGPGTNLQITGGDPTLRNPDELVAIVRHAARAGLRPALFTNGIRARRALLQRLVEAGLTEVAFHVDLTQERKGYAAERDLNAVRLRLIEAARGLPLAIYFNTTVFAGNVAEVPDLVRFFISQADAVNLASFQVQAETGRGIDRRHGGAITLAGLEKAMNEAADGALRFGQFQPGHARCNRYALALVCGGRVHPVTRDDRLTTRLLAATDDLVLDRRSVRRSLARAAAWLVRHPRYLGMAMAWMADRAWAMRRDLPRARGRVHKLSFMIHNFMDACSLERERIDACIFHTATADGTLSMCVHNARRDELTLAPVRTAQGYWDPLTGRDAPLPPADRAVQHSRKTLKGTLRRPQAQRETDRT